LANSISQIVLEIIDNVV